MKKKKGDNYFFVARLRLPDRPEERERRELFLFRSRGPEPAEGSKRTTMPTKPGGGVGPFNIGDAVFDSQNYLVHLVTLGRGVGEALCSAVAPPSVEKKPCLKTERLLGPSL